MMAKLNRTSRTGQFTISSKGKTPRGGEAWEVKSTRAETIRILETSAASAATLDSIVAANTDVLKRLAKK